MKTVLSITFLVLFICVNTSSQKPSGNRPVIREIKILDSLTTEIEKKYDSVITERDQKVDALIEKAFKEHERADANYQRARKAEAKIKELTCEIADLKFREPEIVIIKDTVYIDTTKCIAPHKLDSIKIETPVLKKKNIFRRIFNN